MNEREIRILKYQPLARMVAKIYHGTKSLTPLEDLRQEALVGLIEAVDAFPVAGKGYSFEAFATYRIRRRIEDMLSSGEGGSMSMSQGTFARRQRVARKAQAIQQVTGRIPTREELSEATGFSVRRLDEFEYASRLGTEANASMRGFGKSCASGEGWVEILESLPGEQVDTNVASDLEKLTAAVNALPARQRDVLSRRYGLNGQEEQTLESIAKSLGCTKQNVHIHEQKGMEALRRALVS